MLQGDSGSSPSGSGSSRTEAETSHVREQLRIAAEILDNPGGGLVSGYQALGQARALLAEINPDRYRAVIRLVDEAERQAVWRRFERSRELIREAVAGL